MASAIPSVTWVEEPSVESAFCAVLESREMSAVKDFLGEDGISQIVEKSKEAEGTKDKVGFFCYALCMGVALIQGKTILWGNVSAVKSEKLNARIIILEELEDGKVRRCKFGDLLQTFRPTQLPQDFLKRFLELEQ